MYKIITIVGTRPELIKMSLLFRELDLYTNHLIVHTGQNYDYELNNIFFKDLGIRKPDFFLNVADNKVANTIANVISESDKVFEKEKPDAILLYGDTNSSLSVISAKRRKIPVFHMEAGNRCFDQRVPEEINRKIVDHLSDINFVLTEHARRYLIAEGLPQERIIKSGSHMLEVLNHFKKKINNSKILNKLKQKNKKYFLFSFHREENVDDSINLKKIIDVMNELIRIYKIPIIVSTHPRTKKRLEKINKKIHSKILFLKPFSFFDYVYLQKNALCVISDSGTITEEASILKFPAVTIRNTHERPEGMDEGIVVMSGMKVKNVLNSINLVIDMAKRNIKFEIINDYNVNNVSKKIIKCIFSYIDYVNITVWKKK